MGHFRCDCGANIDMDVITTYSLGASRAESVASSFPKVIADGHDPEEAFLGALALVFDAMHECDDCKRLHLWRQNKHIATWQREWIAESERFD